jgi:hypothetical protein
MPAKQDKGGQDAGGSDLGRSELQATLDEINEKGFRGDKVDPTPNENYTVAGVTSGAPTPETDPDLEAEALLRSRISGGTLRTAAEEHEATLDAAEDHGLDTKGRREE